MINVAYTLMTAAAQRAWPIVISIIIANYVGHEVYKNFYEINVIINIILVILTQGYSVKYIKRPSDFMKDGVYFLYYLVSLFIVILMTFLLISDVVSIKENYRLIKTSSVLSFSLLLSCSALFVATKNGQKNNKAAFLYMIIMSGALTLLALVVFLYKNDIIYFYYFGAVILTLFFFLTGIKIGIKTSVKKIKIERSLQDIYLILAAILLLSTQYISVKLTYSEKDGAVLATAMQFFALAIFIPGNLFSYFLPRIDENKNLRSKYLLMSITFSAIAGIGYIGYSSFFHFDFDYRLLSYALFTAILVFLAVLQSYENLRIIQSGKYIKIFLNALFMLMANITFVLIFRNGLGAIGGLILGYMIALFVSRNVNV